jgi:hypothetical protein
MYPEYILKMLRQRDELDEDDKSQDDIYNRMLPDRVFEEICIWNGFLGGWHYSIKNWIRDIYNVKLGEEYTI